MQTLVVHKFIYVLYSVLQYNILVGPLFHFVVDKTNLGSGTWKLRTDHVVGHCLSADEK